MAVRRYRLLRLSPRSDSEEYLEGLIEIGFTRRDIAQILDIVDIEHWFNDQGQLDLPMPLEESRQEVFVRVGSIVTLLLKSKVPASEIVTAFREPLPPLPGSNTSVGIPLDLVAARPMTVQTALIDRYLEKFAASKVAH